MSTGLAGTVMIEAFWARMQVELLNRKRWKTRIELATAIRDYIEIFHNTRRRHSALNILTPTEYENQHQQPSIAQTNNGGRPVRTRKSAVACARKARASSVTTRPAG
jgi:Integrase core domain